LNDACAHNTILATNTSSISITNWAVVSHPERVLVCTLWTLYQSWS
jgi:3-hydroxybutyryl-CoA dehydrogenase